MISVNYKRTVQFWGFWLLLMSCVSVPSEAQTVYITKSGSKYHSEGCRYLKSSKIPVSLTIALEQGYGPCSVCSPETEVTEGVVDKPAEVDTVSQLAPAIRVKPGPEQMEKKTPSRSSSSSQCTAFTKAGARCKRAAGAGGKCWQHQ